MARRKPPSAKAEDIEWAGTDENPEDWIRDEGADAIDTKNAPLLGQYFREAKTLDPEIIKRVANLLDSPRKNCLRLVFVGPRGRPRKLQTAQKIRMMMVSARREFGNMEAAVAHVSEMTGRSRSGIFALLAPGKKA